MRTRSDLRPGFWLVFWREIGWLRRRRFLLAMVTVVPLFLTAILTAVFSAGLATRLPVGVLDLDGSDLSRTIVRAVDAAPEVAVAVRVGELAEGRHMILSGRIHGLLFLPRDLERDVLAGRRPEVVFFYDTQAMTTGSLVLRGVAAAVPGVAAGLRIALRTAEGQPADAARASLAPIPVDTHPLFNPTLNYVHFLLTALIPAVLQVLVVTTTAYTVGLDAGTRHRLRTLRRLGGGLWPAMAGKLVPYVIAYLIVLGLADIVLFGAFGLPLRGDRLVLLSGAVLFIAACQLLGALIALIIGSTARAVSIATLLMSPAFGFMGIGFPRIAMSAFAHAWGALLPGTWYLMARVDQTVRGTPLDLSWKPVLVLLAFVIGLATLVATRLVALRGRAARRPGPMMPGPAMPEPKRATP